MVRRHAGVCRRRLEHSIGAWVADEASRLNSGKNHPLVIVGGVTGGANRPKQNPFLASQEDTARNRYQRSFYEVTYSGDEVGLLLGSLSN